MQPSVGCDGEITFIHVNFIQFASKANGKENEGKNNIEGIGYLRKKHFMLNKTKGIATYLLEDIVSPC